MSFVTQLGKRGIEGYLALLVRQKLARTKPTIIGVTGSMGKTSTKEAIYTVLKSKWNVYRNPKSLNTEIGLLLAVLEQPSGFSSPFKWAAILASATKNALRGKKYDFMVLEYGADKPGDIEHLIKIVKPHISVITHVARVHQAQGQFKNEEDVFNEKKKLVTCLQKNELAFINHADSFLKKLEGAVDAKTLWFNSPHGIYASDVHETQQGIAGTIHLGQEKEQAVFSVPGTYHMDVFLPALFIGTLQGVPLKEGIAALKTWKLPPGRMSIVEGISNSTLLDSTYNASPQAVIAALSLLKSFPGKRKIAVLGNMNELGDYALEGHREVGAAISMWLDLLITVGELAHEIAAEALKKGFPKTRIEILPDAVSAGTFLRSYGLEKGDIILLKGSQNKVRLERATKMLMKHPGEAKVTLCRQESEWEKI